MKILYAAYRYDPNKPGSETGADYQFLKALQENQFEIKIVGPFIEPPVFLERALKRFSREVLKGQYLKYNLTNTLRASRVVDQVSREWKPDLIFSLYPPPFVFYRGNVPCVFRTDVTFLGIRSQAPEFLPYSPAALRLNVWMEQRALRQSALIITHSEWTRQSIAEQNNIDLQKIVSLPNSSSLPVRWVPAEFNPRHDKEYDGQLRLLFIGREAHRKGLDIALAIVEKLNERGLPSRLTVCGLDGPTDEHVTYTGNLDKSSDSQRSQYLFLLQSSHLLLHPARFDPSPRVTAEAAAFGTPAITNDSGGLATSVQQGVSGIVLPKNSPPELYVQEIINLIQDPERYYQLCRATRERYEKELNWEVAGRELAKILRVVVEGRAA